MKTTRVPTKTGRSAATEKAPRVGAKGQTAATVSIQFCYRDMRVFPLACPCVSAGGHSRAVPVNKPDTMLPRRVTRTATATAKTGSVREMTTSDASAKQSERSVEDPTQSQRS